MKREKSAVLGGSFDPVHIGHISLFHCVSELTPITTLYVIPAFVSNFKRDRRPASFCDRMAMLNAAVMDYADLYPLDDLNIVVSSIEGEKGGVSYTSDTIRLLFDELEDDGMVNFIIGDDILSGIEGWHDYEYIRSHVRFWCFRRGEAERKAPQGLSVVFVDSGQTPASSTDVRQGNLSLVSPSVREYIEENGLYRTE